MTRSKKGKTMKKKQEEEGKMTKSRKNIEEDEEE